MDGALHLEFLRLQAARTMSDGRVRVQVKFLMRKELKVANDRTIIKLNLQKQCMSKSIAFSLQLFVLKLPPDICGLKKTSAENKPGKITEFTLLFL
ncbi:hypothetical protein [Azotosporobacter soli]|uniref:hypothetical protein n=1 Tax=Azotosporobacter soli TaxID=3055040 RepID=UPI0031FF1F23